MVLNKRLIKTKSKPAVLKPNLLLDKDAGQIIAITGGIGTGKSFVLECFRRLDFTIFNMDEAVHDMLKPEGVAYSEVAKIFPESLIQGSLDRKSISDIVFKDIAKLRALEAILHPRIREAQLELTVNAKKNGGKSVVFEVPLLFENQRQNNYDIIIVTISSKSKQKERVLQRKNMTLEKFNAIIEQQVSDEIRLSGAHFIIKTGKSKEDTLRQIKALVKDDTIKRDSTRY